MKVNQDTYIKYAAKECKAFVERVEQYRQVMEHFPTSPSMAEPAHIEPNFLYLSDSFKVLPAMTLFYPYDQALIASLDLVLVSAGWHAQNGKMLADFADYRVEYISPDREVALILWFESSRSGSTCKRVKIGEKTITQDIYEVRCPEPQLESAFFVGNMEG